MKSLWSGGLPGTLIDMDFADRAPPGGVGTLARLDDEFLPRHWAMRIG
jgi:hypothetical protein